MISDALNRMPQIPGRNSGSATNDAGTGMLSALGVRFLDSSGQRLKGCGRDLESIARIDMSSLIPAARESEFIVVADVNTPFCGPDGAARVFAPQKERTLKPRKPSGPRHAFLCPRDSRTVPNRHSTPERSRCSRRIRRRLQSLFKCQVDRRD